VASDPVARIAAALPDADRRSWFRAPGRVNLIGEHTDYNEGFVFPIAIDLECVVAAQPRTDARVRIHSLDEGTAVDIPADGSADPTAVEPAWGRYVAGVVRSLSELGREPAGLDAVLASSVPAGSGLSSSAALEVASALALAEASGPELSEVSLALACQKAEHMATGVPSGIMDQLASTAGRDGSALLVDCRALTVEAVRLPAAAAILVVHSGIERTLERSAYAERRAACERAAASLGLRALRDATTEQVADDPFARHVVSENGRVLEAVDALRTGDLARLGELFVASHVSLRDDYRVSTRELDVLVTALLEAGALGARLTGAGFGGCVVALVERERLSAVERTAIRAYAGATALEPRSFVCRAVSGAGRFLPIPGA
jgi:galactokinase